MTLALTDSQRQALELLARPHMYIERRSDAVRIRHEGGTIYRTISMATVNSLLKQDLIEARRHSAWTWEISDAGRAAVDVNG